MKQQITDDLKCPDCDGWGDEPGTFNYCRTCNGSGRRLVVFPPSSQAGVQSYVVP